MGHRYFWKRTGDSIVQTIAGIIDSFKDSPILTLNACFSARQEQLFNGRHKCCIHFHFKMCFYFHLCLRFFQKA